MPPKNDDSIKKLGERLKELAAQMEAKKLKTNLPPKQPTISDLVAEGNRLLAEETKEKPAPIEVPASTENPYIQARNMVLKKLPEWKRHEIENMEKSGNLDNDYYRDFVHQVAVKGDQLSS